MKKKTYYEPLSDQRLQKLILTCPFCVQIKGGMFYSVDQMHYGNLFLKEELEYIKLCIENTLNKYKEDCLSDKDIVGRDEMAFRNFINKYKSSKPIREEKPDDLYLIHDVVLDKLKIGRSNNPKSRLKQLQIATSNKLELLFVIKGKGNLEAQIHSFFNSINTNSEWFDNDGQIIKYFKEELL